MTTVRVPNPWPKGRGFAGLAPEYRRQIASRGGKATWKRGAAHRWTAEEAAQAGRVGGRTPRRKSKPHQDKQPS